MTERKNNSLDRPLMLGDLSELWIEVRNMSLGQKELDVKLADHMQQEIREMALLRSELKEVSISVVEIGNIAKALSDSMPVDERGKADIFGHRVDHVEIRENKQTRKEDHKTIRNTIVSFLVKGGLTLAVLLVLGEHAYKLMK